MKSTRGHASIREVLAAAGVHQHSPPSRTFHGHEHEHVPSRPHTNLGHSDTTSAARKRLRDRDRDYTECTEMAEMPRLYATNHNGDASPSWDQKRAPSSNVLSKTQDDIDLDVDADADTDEEGMHEEMSRFSLSIDREPTLGYPMDVETPVTGENNGQGSSSLRSARLSCLRCDRWCPPCRGKKVENG